MSQANGTDIDLEQFVTGLHKLAFFGELTFSKNEFAFRAGDVNQLADGIVWLDDRVILYQIKQRSLADAGDENAERKWFENKVLKQATKQIRNSLNYLKSHSKIPITNELGHTFELEGGRCAEIMKIVLYLPSPKLPGDCREIKHHTSQTVGFIHIVNAKDYLEIFRTLRVPEDILDFFRYRERAITEFGEAVSRMPEAILVGHFLSGKLNEPPNDASLQYLHALLQDVENWDISHLLANFHQRIENAKNPYDYYRILFEFAKLPRSGWREVKARFDKCVEVTKAEKFALPFRMTHLDTKCGFVFVPVDPELVKRSDWGEIRTRGVQNFTHAHKYEQKLDKCIGISVAKEGEEFLIDWCLLGFPWEKDAEMDKRLADAFPFREVSKKETFRYRFGKEQ